MSRFDELRAVMDRLRDPGGCPWDREQRLEDLRAYVLEEAYEVIEAIDLRDHDNLCEELGDLLLQVLFLPPWVPTRPLHHGCRATHSSAS